MSKEKVDATGYDRYACGVFIVRADNANFNADFSHMPRELPDGQIYATDKALKYCIRKYIHDLEGKDKVFAWRRFEINKKGKLEPLELEGNIAYLSKKPAKEVSQKEMVELALSKEDVRLFGVTLAVGDKNISITGPCQITYGVNVFKVGSAYTSAILSPYSSKEGNEKSTIGSESRATEVHYVYDFNINPNNLTQDEQINTLFEKENVGKYHLNSQDVQLFKEAITRGVNYVTSTTKVGAVGELLLFVEFEKGSERQVPLVPLLKTKITVSETASKRKIDITEAIKSLKEYSPKEVLVYYDPEYTEVEGLNPNIKCFHIGTHNKV